MSRTGCGEKGVAGFSFVELMAVLAVFGVLSVIATPSILGKLPEKRVKSAARNLFGQTEY